MRDAIVFEFASEMLERETFFDRLQARGTVRLALRQLGIQARSVTTAQMVTLIDEQLAGELESRGVEGAAAVCQRLRAKVLDFEKSSAESKAVESSLQSENPSKIR